jgi:hypothetical protein
MQTRPRTGGGGDGSIKFDPSNAGRTGATGRRDEVVVMVEGPGQGNLRIKGISWRRADQRQIRAVGAQSLLGLNLLLLVEHIPASTFRIYMKRGMEE